MTAMDRTGPRIISVGTSNPPTTYTQQDLLELFECDNRTVQRFFTNSQLIISATGRLMAVATSPILRVSRSI